MTEQTLATATPEGTASYLSRGIKDLLEQFPQLGDVLGAFNIGCVTCAVGTCELNDIVKYHYLPEDQLQDLMGQITAVIDPEGTIEPVRSKAPSVQAVPREITYSPPMQQLVDEHTLIKRWLELIPSIIACIDLEQESDRQLMRDGIDFIRSYADRFHHAKEEDILFKHFDENQEIIRVMLADHATGRNHVKAMVESVETRDRAVLAEHLTGYKELLCEHIKKEDDILYPWMDHQMSITQIGELFQEFAVADGRSEPGMTERFEQFIARLEQSQNTEK